IRIPNRISMSWVRISIFGFVSDFGIRISKFGLCLLRQTHYPRGETVAGMADRLAKIIFVLVNDHRPADNRMFAVQADQGIGHVDLGLAVFIGNNVAQVTDMALLIGGPTVFLVGGIEMAAGRHTLGIREIAELVDVEAVLAFLEAGDLA